MAYCPRCGVEIEDRLEACPLCDTRIPEEVREHTEAAGDYPDDVILPSPMYRKLTGRQKKILIASVILFLGFFPIALTAGIDLARNGAVTWSYYVMVPVIGCAAIAWLFVHYGRKPVISVTAMMLIILVIQLLIGNRNNPADFIRSPELPYFLASFAAIELFLIFITRKHPGILQLLAFILFDAALLIGAIDLILSETLSWSLVVFSCILPLAGYLVYLKKTKKRGLNLVGFFFFDLTLMLLALNYTILERLSWSLVTSLIFVPIAAIFYILHIALFNDTDWKKALHL